MDYSTYPLTYAEKRRQKSRLRVSIYPYVAPWLMVHALVLIYSGAVTLNLIIPVEWIMNALPPWILGGEMNPQDVMPFITDIGSFGFILYIVYHNQKVTLPNFAKTIENQRVGFEKTLAQHRAEAMQALDKIQTSFFKLIENEQKGHAEMNKQIVDQLQHLSDRIDQRND